MSKGVSVHTTAREAIHVHYTLVHLHNADSLSSIRSNGYLPDFNIREPKFKTDSICFSKRCLFSRALRRIQMHSQQNATNIVSCAIGPVGMIRIKNSGGLGFKIDHRSFLTYLQREYFAYTTLYKWRKTSNLQAVLLQADRVLAS